MSVFENSNKFQSAFHLFPHRRCYTHATVLSKSCHFVVAKPAVAGILKRKKYIDSELARLCDTDRCSFVRGFVPLPARLCIVYCELCVMHPSESSESSESGESGDSIERASMRIKDCS